MRPLSHRRKLIAVSVLGGIATMFLIVHPVLEAIHLLRSDTAESMSMMKVIGRAYLKAFSTPMAPMTISLTALGAVLGWALALLHFRLSSKSDSGLSSPGTVDELKALILKGEGEQVEFKSSMRWDRKNNKVNKTLEYCVIKTLSGFLNHKGGILLVGVSDDGEILGIEADWDTLRHPTTDGFEERLIGLVNSHLGSQYVVNLHTSFVQSGGKIVAILHVNPSPAPVFCKEGNERHYFLRAGNTTRRLDTWEAMEHINGKKNRLLSD
jgi:hypothetical protein